MAANDIEAAVDLAAEIEHGVLEALDASGLLTEADLDDPRLDRAKLRFAIYGQVIEAKVQSRTDRREKAITKGALTKRVIPSADDEAVDLVGRRVYEELLRIVWNETNPNQSGFVQKLVGEVADDNGVGYVLVRTRVSVNGNPTDSVYVTSNYDRIAEDFTSPLGEAVTRAAKKYAANASMLIKRGQDAKKVRKGLDAAMTNATALATSTVDLALPKGRAS